MRGVLVMMMVMVMEMMMVMMMVMEMMMVIMKAVRFGGALRCHNDVTKAKKTTNIPTTNIQQ